MHESKLLTEDQLAEIRPSVKEGIRGPVMLKWVRWLLDEHDELVRLEQGQAEVVRRCLGATRQIGPRAFPPRGQASG